MRKFLRSYTVLPLIVVCLGFIITFFSWQGVVSDHHADTLFAFEREQEIIKQSFDNRIDIYINALVAGKSFVKSSNTLTRETWKSYVDILNLQEEFPGIQGYGYAQVIQPEALESHVATVRREGFPDYKIKPVGERELYTSIIYLEPFDVRNQQAFGFDMYSNEIRRKAMRGAALSDQPFATDKVTLVQEIDENVQAGFLIYVPVQNPNQPIDNQLGSVSGFVYSPFRMNDFMEGIVNLNLFESEFLIYDSKDLDPDSLMYSSQNKSNLQDLSSSISSPLEKIIELEIANNTWYMRIFLPLESDMYQTYYNKNYGILLGGGLLSLLLAFTVSLLVRGQSRASILAEQMTHKLREKVNELQDAEEKTRQFSERLTIAADVAGIGFWEWDAVEKEISWNTHMYDIYNKDPGVFIPGFDSWLSIVHPMDQSRVKTMFQTLSKKENRALEEQVSIVTESGEERIVKFYATNKLYEDSSVIVGLNMDVTREHQLDVAKTEFISLASHQLRTPLTAIGWNLESIQSKIQEFADQKLLNVTGRCIKAHERMVELVTGLLQVSRLELGGHDMHLETIAVRNFFSKITQDSKEIALKKNIEFTEHIQDIHLECDLQYLSLVTENIISNAVKYTPKSGKVTLTARADNKDLVVKIVDSGYGIPENEQKKIFTKLYRASNVNNLETIGTGLGLYMAREAVSLLGGTITFTSQENIGTQFSITIPNVVR